MYLVHVKRVAKKVRPACSPALCLQLLCDQECSLKNISSDSGNDFRPENETHYI